MSNQVNKLAASLNQVLEFSWVNCVHLQNKQATGGKSSFIYFMLQICIRTFSTI